MTTGIPTRGRLCSGDIVELGWPEEHEFDRLTALRNRPEVRANFLDARPLDPLDNRQWLRSGMRRPAEALLAIRLRTGGALCGMIGWTGWSTETRAPELGRVAVDRNVARTFGAIRPDGYPGIAVDAARALCDYLFEVAGAHHLRSTYIADNGAAARLNRLVGAHVVARSQAHRPDGTVANVVNLELTRSDWLEARSRQPA